MIASVHIANVGARSAMSLVRKAPKPAEVSGLRHAEGRADRAAQRVVAGQTRSRARRARRVLGRRRRRSIDSSPVIRWRASWPADGTCGSRRSARSERWPGLPADTPTSRVVDHEGPVAALTLGRLRFSQSLRFLRASAKAEAGALRCAGADLGDGLARPPFVSTCSLWESTRALATYAFGRADPAHPDAIAESESKPFHHQQAFIRFRPYGSVGGLDGRNPLAEAWMPAAT